MDASAIDWSPVLFAAFGIGLLVGGAAAWFAARRSGSAARARAEQLATELEEIREEFDQHRESVAKHFGQTSQLFRELTGQYSRLYTHLAHGAREFATGEVPAIGRGLDAPLLEESGGDGEDLELEGDDGSGETHAADALPGLGDADALEAPHASEAEPPPLAGYATNGGGRSDRH